MGNRKIDNIGDCGCTNKKTSMVDPNRFFTSDNSTDYKNINLDNFSVPLEDLSVFVELTTTRKNRTVLTLGGKNGGFESSSGKNGTISFIDGTDVNGKKVLTTSYTDLRLISETDNIETLGITNIDIEFNSSYAPLITINFEDVRGATFQRGTKSKASVFFELPYPIFSLTIKGYYGTPVKYCLHLTKHTTKFNSSTGNFEITASFVGYTYAILSDMLMGYLKAITYTDIGRKKFEEYKKLDPTLITLNELTSKIGEINKYITALRDKDKEVGILNDIERALNSLDNIKSILNEKTSSLYIEENRVGGEFVFLTSNATSDKIKKNNDILTTYKNEITERIKTLNDSLNNISKLNNDVFTTINIYNKINKKYLNNLVTKEELISSEISKNKTDNSERNAENVRKLKDQLLDGIQLLGDGDYTVYDFSLAYSTIKDTKDKLEANKTELNKKIGLKATTDIAGIVGGELPLDPTIRNIIKIFTTHIEIFLYCIWQVAANTKNNTQRTAEIKKLLAKNQKAIDGSKNLSQTNGENGVIPTEIYPFPEFRKFKSDGQGLEEAYIGGEDGITNNVDEVKFIEDLLRGMLEASKNDQDSTQTITDDEEGWYPVSPLDTKLFIKNNPYTLVSNSLTDNILRLVGFRAMTYIGITNKYLNTTDVKLMATLEARNAFDHIQNKAIKEDIAALDKDGVLTKLTAPNSKILMNGLFNSVFIPVGDEYQFYYIIDAKNDDVSSASYLDNRTYIPVYGSDSGTLDGDIFYQVYKDRKMLSYNDVIGQTDGSSYFISNYNSDIVSTADDVKLDDGGIYIKIFEQSEFDSNLTTKPPIEENLTKSLGIKELSQSDLAGNTSYLNPGVSNALKTLNKFNLNNPISNDYGIQTYSTLVYTNNDGISSESVEPLWPLFFANNFNLKVKQANSVVLKRPQYLNTISQPLRSEDKYNTRTITQFGNKNPEYYFINDDINNLTDSVYYKQNSSRKFINSVDGITSYPNISFNIKNYDTEISVSLFGSRLYNEQKTKEAKAFLFLHTISWNGLVSDSKSLDSKYKQGIFNTPEIRSLFVEGGSFINAPKLWCAFVGGLLWRYKFPLNNDPIKFYDTGSSMSYIDGIPSSPSNFPSVTQYLTTTGVDGPMVIGNLGLLGSGSNPGKYLNIESVLANLPEQAKTEFINQFNDFVNGSAFDNLINSLELRNSSGGTYSNWTALYDSVVSDISGSPNSNLYDLNSVSKLNKGTDNGGNTMYLSINDMKSRFINFDNYITFSPIRKIKTTDFKYNFELVIWDDAPVMTNVLLSMFRDTVMIANITHRIWAEPANGTGRSPIKARKSVMDYYMQVFITEFKKLNQVELSPEKDKEVKQNIFGVMDNDVIRLNLYRTVKSIYDKWIGGSSDGNNIIFQCGSNEINNGRNSIDNDYAKVRTGKDTPPQLIDSFRFVTRSFREIGDKFYINPLIFKELLLNNWNQSFADVLSRLLTANNFEFVPLPSFIDYSNPNNLAKMFKPLTYNQAVSTEVCGPSFVCVYIGQSSNKLDLDNSEYDNDGFDFNCSDTSSEFQVGVPDDFSPAPENSTKYPEVVSVFAVNYGQQNQNIFRDITLDQQEFTETAESLQITDDIANRGSQTNQTLVGQNLFNTYQVRSYTAEVEMLGNAMIQPMMYFQLNNIPMFHGAYLITRVKHSLRPNYMNTRFTGTRVRAVETPLLDSATLYMSIIGSIKSENNTPNGSASTAVGIDSIPEISIAKLNFGNPYKGEANISRGLIGGKENHQGIDFKIQAGTELIPITDGTIEWLKYHEEGYGLYVVINHDVLGEKKQVYKTVYGHLSELDKSIFKGVIDLDNMTTTDITRVTNGINLNIKINKGTTFAKSGGKQGVRYLDMKNKKHDLAGTVSTGAHLHFELHIGGEDSLTDSFKSKSLPYVNPLPYIPAGLDPKFKKWNPDKPEQDVGEIAFIPVPSNNDRLNPLGKI